jgi:hypothetical protein
MRAAMTIFIAGYLLFSLFALLQIDAPKSTSPHVLPTLDAHNPLALLSLFHALILLYVLPPPKYLYMILSETDVANLYPAPLERWRVFRFFLLTRSFLVFYFLVGIWALYGSMMLRAVFPGILSPVQHGSNTLWTFLYVLCMIAAIAGLLCWRLLLDILREFKRIRANAFRYAAILVVSSIMAVLLYHVGLAISAGKHPIVGLIASTESYPFVILLAPFRMLAEVLLREADFSSAAIWVEMLFWVGLAATGYGALKHQSSLLYEYAARLASFRTEMMVRMRIPGASIKEKAAKETINLQLPWFLKIMDPRRAGAIFWRDMVVAWRGYGTVIKWLHNLFLLAVVAGWFVIVHYGVSLAEEKIWVVGSLLLLLPIAPLSMLSVSSVAEILRRSDIQKPLPIGGLESIAMHILQWTAMICSVTLLPYVAGAILFHAYWHIILFLLVISWSFSHTFISAGFLIALFNPDQDDPVQRLYAASFGFFSMLGSSLPGALVLVLCFLLHFPMVLILVIVIIVNGTTAAFLHYLCAQKYADFVFTE